MQWLDRFRARGPPVEREGIGCRIEVEPVSGRVQFGYATRAGSYQSEATCGLFWPGQVSAVRSVRSAGRPGIPTLQSRRWARRQDRRPERLRSPMRSAIAAPPAPLAGASIRNRDFRQLTLMGKLPLKRVSPAFPSQADPQKGIDKPRRVLLYPDDWCFEGIVSCRSYVAD